jgi:hypothetical protein
MYSLPNIIEVIKQRLTKWTGYVYSIGEGRNVYRPLVEKPEEKIGLRRSICIWEDNITINHKETW